MVFLLSLNHGYIHVNNIFETPYSGIQDAEKVQTTCQNVDLSALAAISRYGCNVRLIFLSSPFIKKQLYFIGNLCVI
jgi:hypothetical protein